MRFVINYSLIFILFKVILGDIRHICNICRCDNVTNPITVNCNSKGLSSLKDIKFSTTIETLTFINNSLTLESIYDIDKLNNITSLKSLVLSNNPLDTIPELSLTELINLEFNSTNIKHARFPKSYEHCQNLQTIILSNNRIQNITKDNFQSLVSIKHLVIDNSQIEYIENDAFIHISKSIESISLVSNLIHSASFLFYLPTLTAIDFDRNKFESLPNEILQLRQAKQLFFRNNQINTIDQSSPISHWIKANLSNIEIYLENNPFDCCQSRWFINYLTKTQNFVKDSRNLTCALPNLYAGKRLIDLNADLMDCYANETFLPSNVHWNITIVIMLCLVLIVTFTSAIVISTLYRRNKFHIRRRHRRQYLQFADDIFASSY